MENKNIILLGILIIGILGFLYSSNITSYATKNSCSDTDEGINSVSFGECPLKQYSQDKLHGPSKDQFNQAS